MASYMTKTFAKYLRLGVVPRPVRGNWKDGDYMYSIYHDDVQYTIDDMGDYEIDSDVSYILQCLKARDLIIDRNHDVVRFVYEYLVNFFDDNVWVRVNSGIQLSCSFGDRDGIFAHLSMDFVNQDDYERAVDKFKQMIKNLPGFDEVEVPDGFVMMVTDQRKLHAFDEFNHPKIKVLNIGDIDE